LKLPEKRNWISCAKHTEVENCPASVASVIRAFVADEEVVVHDIAFVARAGVAPGARKREDSLDFIIP
jgi:hypothetical protein